MAIKKIIEIDVDQVQAMGGLDALQNSLAETEKSSASLKAELRKLKEQLAQLPEGSEEYNKIAQRAGEVSDKIGDINTRIKNLGSDTKNIDAVVQGTQALSGAFSVATSASALLGEENKDLQETMLKVESAIGLTVGIQSIANALQKESALAIGLSSIATKIQIGLQVAYATVVGTTTGALKLLRIALVSTGVGALVVALGFLIEKLMSGTKSTETYEEAQNNLNNAIAEQNRLLDLNSKAIDNKTKLDLLRGKLSGKTESELLDIEKKAYADREKLYAEDTQLKFKLFQDAKNNATLKAEDIKKAEDAYISANQKWNDAIQNGLEFNLGKEVEFQEERKKQREKENEEAKRKAKERAEEEKRIAKEKYDALLKEANDFFSKAKEAQENYDKDFADNFKRQEEELEKFESPEDKQLKEANRRLVEIENFNGALSEKKAMLEEYTAFVNNQEFLTDEAKKYYENQALERKKIIQQQELALSAETFGKVAMLLGKNSKIGKAFAVGQALINTYQGITAELATKAVTPYEIGLKVANIAFVASTGFKAVKNILSTNPMSSGGGGSASSGGASGGGGSSAPQFNLVGQSSTNQLTATIAGQQNRPVQTFVVGSQVTSQQALDRNAVANSVFG
jgi:myosin heavy subunit